jgi:tetratricopeptide (TPR) repeat protein
VPSIRAALDECLPALERAGVLPVLDPRDWPEPGAAELRLIGSAVGRLREALRDTDLRVRASEAGYEAQLLLARALACRGRASARYTEAHAAASAAAQCCPLRAEAFVVRGQVSFLRGLSVRRWLSSAILDFTRALRCAPGDAAALLGRALCREVPALDDLAVAERRRADGREREALEALVEAEDAIAAAVVDHDTLLARHPDHGLALLHRGACLARIGKLEAARADLDRIVELGPDAFGADTAERRRADRVAQAHVERARIEAAQGELPAAIADLDRAEAVRGRAIDDETARYRAELALAADMPAAAVRYLSSLIEAGADRRLLLLRADAYFRMNDFEHARADASRVLAADAANAEARLIRSRCAAALGSWQSAIADLDRVLDRQPRDASCLSLRAKAELESGDLREAVSDAKAALAEQARDADALLTLGSAYYFLGERGLAEPVLRRASELGSTTATARIQRWYGTGS